MKGENNSMPVIKPLDNTVGKNGYIRSDRRDSPWNRSERQRMFQTKRDRALANLMRRNKS